MIRFAILFFLLLVAAPAVLRADEPQQTRQQIADAIGNYTFSLTADADAETAAAAAPGQLEQRPVRAAVLRTVLTFKAFRSNSEQRAAIQSVLHNQQAFDALLDSSTAVYTSHGGPKGGKFLDWIMANWQTILNLIMQFIPHAPANHMLAGAAACSVDGCGCSDGCDDSCQCQHGGGPLHRLGERLRDRRKLLHLFRGGALSSCCQ